MAAVPATFVLFHLFSAIYGHYMIIDDDYLYDGVSFPIDYHYNGEIITFITGLVEPFELWHSGSFNRSRIDYYGGTEKRYYNMAEQRSLDIHPMTDEDLNTEEICIMEESGTDPVDILPDVTNMVYAGTDTVLDKEVDVWKYETSNSKMKIEKVLYVYKNSDYEDILVQVVIKQYNLDSGAIDKHTIMNFYNFHNNISEEDVTYENYEDCVFTGESFEQDIMMLRPHVTRELDAAFQSYLAHHQKSYETEEHKTRKMIFEENWRMINEVNNKNLGYKLALNEFSDQTAEELKYLTGIRPSDFSQVAAVPFPYSEEEITKLAEELPEHLDLRMEGYITPIKHQGSCGSCWAFCTTAAVEGAYALKNSGKLLDLSEQSLVDCAWGFHNLGCDGGQLDGALNYVNKYGIPTEESYGSYQQEDGYCHVANVSDDALHKISGFGRVTPQSPNALKAAIDKYGPVTVTIYATNLMTHYSSGIFYDFTCEDDVYNHGVTVVGYGVRDDEDYWIVKNSWGESWGEDGYILMSAKNNNCNLQDNVFYIIL